ncbi:MAG: argininosuccinate synthase [Gemmatimonadota bacterium]|jgi:argininosuccinate synthase|nr:argininosuccinate synthase [Gemmatimonadota bacterium]
MPTFVLAYSGGLDTSCILAWLREKHGADVVTVTADLGQRAELVGLREKAAASGAVSVRVEDLRGEFVGDFLWPSLRVGALYQEVYPLATALGRPLIAKRLVEIAREVGADAVVHGCTGKGNDQVRLEIGVQSLAPELQCIAPLREWELTTREQEIAWATERGIPVGATKDSPYSIDENLWGSAIEAGALEDPWAAPPSDCWILTTDPREAPDAPEEVTIGFESGTPVSLDGDILDGVTLIDRLNTQAGDHGVGRLDMIEDRLVGIKSREVYEAPAAVTLHTARTALEQLTLDRETRRVKGLLAAEFARLVYDGLWYTPLRESIQSFADSACHTVTGEVRMSLYRGSATPTGRSSPHALYDHSLATYGEGDAFGHASAPGFIDLFGLGARTAAQVRHGADPHSLPSARESTP